MTKKEEKIFFGIQEAITVECSIMCSKCKKVDRVFGVDDYIFTEYLIKHGWNYKRGSAVCSGCS